MSTISSVKHRVRTADEEESKNIPKTLQNRIDSITLTKKRSPRLIDHDKWSLAQQVGLKPTDYDSRERDAYNSLFDKDYSKDKSKRTKRVTPLRPPPNTEDSDDDTDSTTKPERKQSMMLVTGGVGMVNTEVATQVLSQNESSFGDLIGIPTIDTRSSTITSLHRSPSTDTTSVVTRSLWSPSSVLNLPSLSSSSDPLFVSIPPPPPPLLSPPPRAITPPTPPILRWDSFPNDMHIGILVRARVQILFEEAQAAIQRYRNYRRQNGLN